MRVVQAFMVLQLEDAGAPPAGGPGGAAAWEATRTAVAAREWRPPIPGVRLAHRHCLLIVICVRGKQLECTQKFSTTSKPVPTRWLMLCRAPCAFTIPQGGVGGDPWLANDDSSISSVLAGSASDTGMAEYIKSNNYLGPGCDPWLQVCLNPSTGVRAVSGNKAGCWTEGPHMHVTCCVHPAIIRSAAACQAVHEVRFAQPLPSLHQYPESQLAIERLASPALKGLLILPTAASAPLACEETRWGTGGARTLWVDAWRRGCQSTVPVTPHVLARGGYLFRAGPLPAASTTTRPESQALHGPCPAPVAYRCGIDTRARGWSRRRRWRRRICGVRR